MSMIVDDVTGRMVRSVRNIFTLRDNAVPDSPHGPAVEEASQMDYETANWPIPDEFALHVDSIKFNLQATPLPVFYEGNLIQPIHTNTVLNGCIVEIEFTVRRWKIQDHDTFQATAENVTTLRLGAVHHNTNYKPRTSTTTTMGRKINKIPERLTRVVRKPKKRCSAFYCTHNCTCISKRVVFPIFLACFFRTAAVFDSLVFRNKIGDEKIWLKHESR
ncbi:hypothetical protein DFJ58DRAFT_34720 [Suillus subalutaceus]|uniref:uncharacterized protein n=1 Tax=Suillus subalutaceus TaxID=48586 RepID=UPI001B866D76|nr:uncharacterized protein DFJ58DRAFT_34720 [Suillus subalutaceus]KAG1843789.1 hypothetical protein DFJ58DRAFT_34720 [Suillus subalutaceus]